MSGEPRYRLRFFFDPGAGVCLWSGNDAARERFGYPVENRSLPVPENLWRLLEHLCAWHATSIDWSYPPDPSPWTPAERHRFDESASAALEQLRTALGPEFLVVDERRRVNQRSAGDAS
jgi:hypothetical protein